MAPVAECIFYPLLFERVEDIVVRQDYNILMSALVFCLSLAISAMINVIYCGIEKLGVTAKMRIKDVVK